LILMILFQASFTALTGYGLGIGLCALATALAKMRLPDYAAMITFWNLGLAFVMVVISRPFPVISASEGCCGSNRSIFSKVDMDAPIKATGIVKWFGEGEARASALKDVSIEAYFGEMLYIVGPSGSGKTTLLSVLSGILRPDSGSVSVEGADIWKLSGDKLADFRLHKIGFVFQDFHLFPRLTTAENVAIPLILKRQNWSDAIVEAKKYLEIVGLKGRTDLPPVKLSGGKQQRVAIARAIVGQPDIMIMDERHGPIHRPICKAARSQ
jgi:putative ABC transport system ATP-binding protein